MTTIELANKVSFTSAQLRSLKKAQLPHTVKDLMALLDTENDLTNVLDILECVLPANEFATVLTMQHGRVLRAYSVAVIRDLAQKDVTTEEVILELDKQSDKALKKAQAEEETESPAS